MRRIILLLLVIVSGTVSAQTEPADSTSEHGKDLLRDTFFPHWETADKGVYVGWGFGAMMDMERRHSSHFGIDINMNIGF